MFDISQIRNKLILLTFIVLIFSGVIIFLTYDTIKRIGENYDLLNKIEKINTLHFRMTNLEKNFMIHDVKDPSFYQNFHSNNFDKILALNDSVKDIIDTLVLNYQIINDDLKNDLKYIKKVHRNYEILLRKVIELNYKRGFKDWGEIGKMRGIIHQVEDSPLEYDRAYMLMLRRHEKDFLLRKDIKYKKKFDQDVEQFLTYLNKLALTSTDKEKIEKLIAYVKDYHAAFNAVIDIETDLGLDESQGLNGSLNKISDEIKTLIPQVSKAIQNAINRSISKKHLFLVVLFSSQATLLLFFAIYLAKLIGKKLYAAKDFILQLANGKSPQNFEVKGTDEISIIFKALNQLNQRIQIASGFAQSIGEGFLDKKYPQEFDHGNLETALIKMRNNLQNIKKKEALRNEYLKKTSKIVNIIRGRFANFAEFTNTAISEIVKILAANQGMIFIQSSDGNLQLHSTYAYNKTKYLQKTIAPGQGQTGQCFLEKMPIILKKVPQNYLNITSGLGKSLPENVLILPILFDDQALGVLEIASFTSFSEQDIELAKSSADAIASVLKFNYQEETISIN